MVFQKGQLFSAVLWTCLIIYIVILIKFIKKNTHLPRKVVLSEDLKTSTTVLPQPQITSELYQLMPSQKSSLEILEEEILTSIFQNLNFSQFKMIKEDGELEEALGILANMFDCEFDKISSDRFFVEEDLLRYHKDLWKMMWPKGLPNFVEQLKWQNKNKNPSFESAKFHLKDDLKIPELQNLANEYCRKFPIQMYKILRLDVESISTFILDKSIIKFETLAKEPLKIITNLLESMSLNVTSNTLEYLGTHTVEDKFPNEPWSTIRNSSGVSGKWKEKLNLTRIQEIEKVCSKALLMWSKPKLSKILN